MGSRASPQGDAFPEGPLEAVWCSHSVFCLRAWSLSKEELRSPGIRVKLVTVTNGATGKSEPRILVAAAKSLQSCPTLCDPMDGSPPGSTIPGILQARTLEWVAISFSSA